MSRWKHIRYVLIDETAYLNDKPEALEIFGTIYAYFPDTRVYACEITPSYELWPLKYLFNWNPSKFPDDYEADTVAVQAAGTTLIGYEEEIGAGLVYEQVKYIHCADLDRSYKDYPWRFNDILVEVDEFKDIHKPDSADEVYEYIREMEANGRPWDMWFDKAGRENADRIYTERFNRRPKALLKTYSGELMTCVEFVPCAPAVQNGGIASELLAEEGCYGQLLNFSIGSNQTVVDTVYSMGDPDAKGWLAELRADPNLEEAINHYGLPCFQRKSKEKQ